MRRIIQIIIFSLFLGGCTIPFTNTQKSALDIKSTPKSTVYINEDAIGSTPFYKDNLKPGEYTIRIEPEDDPNNAWSIQVDLKPQLLTSIQKNFGPSKDTESHFTLSLKPINQSNTSLKIIATPDSSVVKINDQPVGFSPVEKDTFFPGDHKVVLSSPGYKDLFIPIKLIEGHQLTISAQLSKDKTTIYQTIPRASSSALPKPSPLPEKATSSAVVKKSVKITKTGTGWLRVRKDPSKAADNEVFRVDVGKAYPLLDDAKIGWYQIEYIKGKRGWISSQYAQIQ